MSDINFRLNLFACFLFIYFVKNSFGGICNLCVCTESGSTKTVNCEGKRAIDNYMEIFDLLAFTDQDSVDKLILSNHQITSLPLDTFRRHNELKSLDLSKNSIEIFEADIFKDLKSLEELNFSFNGLKVLKGAAFNGLLSLLKLNLSNNKISNFNDTTADQLPKLTHLDLSHNYLQTIESDFIKSLTKLLFLDVSFNKIISLSGETILQLRSLIHLRATNNLLTNISGEDLPHSLKKLSVGNNMISSMSLGLSRIHQLNIQDNSIAAIESDAGWFQQLNNLNISGNFLTTLPDVKFNELRSLDISRNKFKTIPQTLTTNYFPALKMLLIGGNPIRDFTFDRELHLQSLVACNLYLLEAIEDNAFRNLKGLDDDCINLTVSGNPRLNVIKKGAFNGVTICFLDLSKNALTRIFPEVIKSEGKFVVRYGIDLQGNPLHCDCESQWMLNDLVPHLYQINPRLLDDLRCDRPIEQSGRRLVHWLKWNNKVFCNSLPAQLSKKVNAVVSVSPRSETVMLETSKGMLAIVAGAMVTLCILITVGILIAWKTDIRRRRSNRRF